MQKTKVWPLDQEDHLEKEITANSSIPAWRMTLNNNTDFPQPIL